MVIRSRGWWFACGWLAFIVLCGVAFADGPDPVTKLEMQNAWEDAVFEAEDSKAGKLFNLEGTWFGRNSWGSVYMVTIIRTGIGRFEWFSDANLDPNAAGMGTTMVTSGRGEIVRVGLNSYQATSAFIYGTEDFDVPPYFGTAYVGFANGTIIQTGPDSWMGEFWAEMSCNPCWPGCWADPATCDPATLWDPFNDPYAVCLGEDYNPVYLTYTRTPVVEPCGP